jgi:hypothetical protein
MILTFIYTREDVFRQVKSESSVFAERQRTADGNSLFESFVFDEQHKNGLFTKYFIDAQVEVALSLGDYIPNRYVNTGFYNPNNSTVTDRFVLQLDVSDNFLLSVRRALHDTIMAYMADYIMYLWLRTKEPNAAQIYYASAKEKPQKMYVMINKRDRHQSRQGSYW